MSKYILGIESSCDDTAVALVSQDSQVKSSVVISQDKIHENFGGIYPEFASRAHVHNIIPSINQVLEESCVTIDEIEAIGVTRGPGLMGSLLVGLNTATALGMGWQKQVIGINHLRGHLRSAELEGEEINYPAIILLVSGGHTFLAFMRSKLDIELIGETRDDSAGETFDKVGRMLGLGFPAGPIVDKLARKGKVNISFPRPLIHEGLEFSFSGLKSSVARYLEKQIDAEIVIEDVAASFVQAVMDVLLSKCTKAIQQYKPSSLVIVGGVAASSQLREGTEKICKEYGIKLCLPPIKWATDNAAMIGLATWDYIENKVFPIPKPELNILLSDF